VRAIGKSSGDVPARRGDPQVGDGTDDGHGSERADGPPRTDGRGTPTVVAADDGRVVLEVGRERHALDRVAARRLRADLSEALHRVREFLHTAGEHRPDGAYVVSRRRASSSGHSKRFESVDRLRAVYGSLPREFVADDVTVASGGRRHLLVRHFAEHPGFDCEIVSEQPLTARKRGADGDTGSRSESGGRADGAG